MSYRELLQLAIDQSSWRSQSGDEGIADGRLRSQRIRRRQPVETDGDHENVPDRGRRRGRVPPRRRQDADRSRSPIQPAEQPETSGVRINDGTELRTAGEYQPRTDPSTLEEPAPGPSTREPLNILQGSRDRSRSPQQTSERLEEPAPSTSQLVPNIQPTAQATNNRPVRGRRLRGRRARQIQRLPSRSFTDNEDLQSCTICMEDYEIGEQVTVLPCSHVFHLPCIARWIRANPHCPLCRVRCF